MEKKKVIRLLLIYSIAALFVGAAGSFTFLKGKAHLHLSKNSMEEKCAVNQDCLACINDCGVAYMKKANNLVEILMDRKADILQSEIRILEYSLKANHPKAFDYLPDHKLTDAELIRVALGEY